MIYVSDDGKTRYGTPAEMMAEIDRLRAALPKTADGIPIVPGMVIFPSSERMSDSIQVRELAVRCEGYSNEMTPILRWWYADQAKALAAFKRRKRKDEKKIAKRKAGAA